MTEKEEQILTEELYKKPVGELIQMIIKAQRDLEEVRNLKKRLVQIRNIALNQEERRSPGRPRKGETDNLLFGKKKKPDRR